MKIVSIVGARPQFIKLAPIAKKLSESNHEHIILHTGQHYDYEMSKIFFDELEIPKPDFNFEIGSGTHAEQTGKILLHLGETLYKISPDLVLVYGDTNSTLAGALAAVKLHIPVGHVEAGYRSHDISMPEEVNRVVTDRISQVLFAPTEDAVNNLISEGISSDKIFFVGNIMAESLLSSLGKLVKNETLNRFSLLQKTYGILTIHRPENTNTKHRLESMIKGIIDTDFPVVFPVHPRTVKFLEDYHLVDIIKTSNIIAIEPLNYLDFLKLESEAKFILTDSGGIQEEAILLGVPCLTLRYNTERTLTLQLGANKLVGADSKVITQSIFEINKNDDKKFQKPENWDTKVSSRILSTIQNNIDLLSIKPQIIDLQAVMEV